MDAEEKQEAKSEYRAKSQSKYYEMYCLSHNKTAYNGMSLNRRLWEPFTPYTLHHGSIAPLRSFLGRLAQDWDDLGLTGLCPFSFTEEELKKHNKEAEEYKVISELWDMVKTALYTNGDGWVPKDRWEATTELNKELYDKFMECVDQEPDEAAKMYDKYPFPPQNYC